MAYKEREKVSEWPGNEGNGGEEGKQITRLEKGRDWDADGWHTTGRKSKATQANQPRY